LGLLLHEDVNLVFNFPYGGFETVPRALLERMVDRKRDRIGR